MSLEEKAIGQYFEHGDQGFCDSGDLLEHEEPDEHGYFYDEQGLPFKYDDQGYPYYVEFDELGNEVLYLQDEVTGEWYQAVDPNSTSPQVDPQPASYTDTGVLYVPPPTIPQPGDELDSSRWNSTPSHFAERSLPSSSSPDHSSAHGPGFEEIDLSSSHYDPVNSAPVGVPAFNSTFIHTSPLYPRRADAGAHGVPYAKNAPFNFPVFQQEPHSVFCFGFGGVIISTFPHHRRSLSNVREENKFHPGSIRIRKVGSIAAEDDFLHLIKTFPGPLTRATKPEQIYSYLEQIMDSISMQSSNSINPICARLLWKLIKLFYEHDGAPVTPAAGGRSDLGVAIVRMLLSKGEDGEDDLLDQSGSLPILKGAAPRSQENLDKLLSVLQSLLLQGKQDDAIKFCLENELWTHALLIASSMNQSMFQNVVNRFAFSRLADCSPLQTLYVSKCGQTSSLFFQNVERPQSGRRGSFSDVPLVKNWAANLSMVLSNPSANSAQQRAVITQLGDTLWKYYGQSEAAHFCYLAADELVDAGRQSRIILVGGDHLRYPRTFVNVSTIHRTELYELSKKKKDKNFVLAAFQPYKLLYASLLVDLGLNEQALDYVEQIQLDLQNSNKIFFRNQSGSNSAEVYYTSTFLNQLSTLEARLKLVGIKSASRKSSISASRVISSIFLKVSDFFVGAESDEPSEAALTADVPDLSFASASLAARPSANSRAAPRPVVQPKTEPPAKAQNPSSGSPGDKLDGSPRNELAGSQKEENFDGGGVVSSIFGLFQPKKIPQADLEDDSKIWWDPVQKKWIIQGGVEPSKPEPKTAPPPPPRSLIPSSQPPPTASSTAPPPARGRATGAAAAGRGGGVSSRYALPPSVTRQI
eukprot:TRINITY_DN35238_c0_g2_i1.p1 TRINITY_DN35238_c0_g2~~TRINITY_DN35238_c0_g2_i1.p1  ORF type:complete len:866 (-),score=177.06 TRINITY_DN35238_c0_g2_i1:19-2616(-)